MKFICKGCVTSCVIRIKDPCSEPPAHCPWICCTTKWVVKEKKIKEKKRW
jgi:hypothetical protein